jgi:hypothetical protein
VLLLWVSAAALSAQQPAVQSGTVPAPTGALVTEMYSLRHRPVGGAIGEVEGLLSAQGTIELQPRGNTLVIRDTVAVVRRVLARLRDYDQPLRRVRLEVQIVRAGGAEANSESGQQQLPPDLVRRLRELLRFESFRLLAQAGLEMMEGEQVIYQFGGEYSVEFELGVVSANRQLRLQDFIVGRGESGETRPLIHTNLNLTLERPMVLGLAQTEASERALMVVLTSRLMQTPVSEETD